MAEWYNSVYRSKGHIEIGNPSLTTLPYLLEIHRVDGLSKLKTNIELNVYFYDSTTGGLYGTPWKSAPFGPPFNLGAELVFYSDVKPTSMLLLELVQIESSGLRQAIGWSCHKISSEAISTTSPRKVDVYHGSLRAIFYFKEPSVASSQLLRYEGVSVSLSVSQRSVVRRLTSHLPSNYLLPPTIISRSNKTCNPITVFLEDVEVTFGVHIRKFEEYMLSLLLLDAKQNSTHIRQFEKITIKERRLKASIHNGINFTDQFQVVYLENVQNSDFQSLRSKGVISLAGIDPRNHLIFSLEYVMEVPLSFVNLTLVSSMRQSQVHMITLRWGVWSLSKALPISGSVLRVPLTGGPGLNPEKKLIFTSDFGPLNTNRDSAVSFKLVKQEADREKFLNVTYQDTSVQPDPAPALRTTGTMDSFSVPVIEVERVAQNQSAAPDSPILPPLRHHPEPAKSGGLEGSVVALPPDTKPAYHQELEKQDLDKAVYAQLHNAGYPDIADPDGRPALELDLSKHYVYSAALERNDPRTCNTVHFQFLAVSGLDPSVRNLFCTVQFYCFPAETTPILTTRHTRPNLPSILYKFNQTDQSPGCIVKFKIDPGVAPNEPDRFLKHIQEGSCTIDLWDADSLFHVGSVTAKLKRLARQGEHGVQTTQVFDIHSTDQAMHSIGKLHLRIANIGSHASIGDLSHQKASLVVECCESGLENEEKILRPRPLSNIDQNLNSILRSETLQTKNRKQERMEAVRRSQNPSYIVPREAEVRVQREEQLLMVQNYRAKILNEVIREALVGSVTRSHTLHTAYGAVAYWEVHYRNTTSTTQTYWITWDTEDIRLVYDSTEAKILKSLFNVATPLDPELFESSKKPVRLTLRSGEDVYIPFLYSSTTTKQEFEYTIKLLTEEHTPVQLIRLTFRQQRQVLSERFLFSEPEETFAKHSLAVPGAPSEQLKVRCSDPSVLCSAEGGRVVFKAPVPKTPQTLRFLIMIYTDGHCYLPAQIWEIVIYSQKKIELSAVVGTEKIFPVILRGTDAVRVVQCYSSNNRVLKLEPDREFILSPNNIQEVRVKFEPLETGVRDYQVNVVDTKNRVLLERWVLHTTADLPVVSKTYDLPLSRSLVPTTKQISFVNPYTTERVFRLKTNKPELLSFRESELSVPSKQSVNIGLLLSPLAMSHVNHILVFVNDVQQKCEECFAVRIA